MTRQPQAAGKAAAIIQARMGSTRLPGKSLASIGGRPLLARVIERCRASRLVDSIWTATTLDAEDDAIERLARQIGVDVFRGSVHDVLDRFYRAALEASADVIVRITADDPFIDPAVIDRILTRLMEGDLDYVSNTLEPTYPEGLDIEAFTFATLAAAWREAKLGSEREHVTPYIWKNPRRFRIENVRLDVDLSHHRWTIDYREDLEFARAVYAELDAIPIFAMADILKLLAAKPELQTIHAHIVRNQGYLQSLAADGMA